MFKPQNILSQKATQLILTWFKSTTQYYNLVLNLFATKLTTKTSEHQQWHCAGVFQILWVSTHTMFKHTQTICWLLLTNCLGVFKHFVGFVLQRLKIFKHFTHCSSVSVDFKLATEKKLMSILITWYTTNNIVKVQKLRKNTRKGVGRFYPIS